MAKKNASIKTQRRRPASRPKKFKTSVRFLADDWKFINELIEQRLVTDPYGATIGQILHEAIAALRAAQQKPFPLPSGRAAAG